MRLSASWSVESTAEYAKYATQVVHSALDPIRAFTPESGAYGNEVRSSGRHHVLNKQLMVFCMQADVYEPNHEQSFWGPNHARLLKIKQQYDPQGVFQVWHGVGWQGPNDKLFQCYRVNRPNGADAGF